MNENQVEYSTLADQVRQNIKKRIINQELKPGSRLIVSHLAAEMGTSLTPIREALRLLVKDGLVEIIPHKGAQVVMPSQGQFKDLFEVRTVLESLAIKLAIPNLSPADYERLEQILQAGDESIQAEDPKTWLDADEKLHSYIIQKSENNILAELLDNIRNRINIFRILTAQLPARAKRAQNEHRSVVAAMKKQKDKNAEELIVQHIENTYEVGITA